MVLGAADGVDSNAANAHCESTTHYIIVERREDPVQGCRPKRAILVRAGDGAAVPAGFPQEWERQVTNLSLLVDGG